VTWPFYNIYLGIVMVFDAVDPPNVYNKGKVHCELAMTADPNMTSGWHRVAPGNDFIPLGAVRWLGKGAFDSHICFASGLPLRLQDEIRVYYMGGVRLPCTFTHPSLFLLSLLPLPPPLPRSDFAGGSAFCSPF